MAKPAALPTGVRDDLRAFREEGLLGVVLAPVDFEFFKTGLDGRQGLVVAEKRATEDIGNGLGCLVICRRSEPSRS